MINDTLALLTAALANPRLETVSLFAINPSLIGRVEDVLAKNLPRPFVRDSHSHYERRYLRVGDIAFYDGLLGFTRQI